MASNVVQQETTSTKLINRWEQVCQKLAALGEEFPASKFNSSPVEGTRTVADVLRHVAFWNHYVAETARERKGEDSANELPKDKFVTKSQIISELNRSAAQVTDALKTNASGFSPELTETVVTFIEHNCEHYGQLVVYARLNGIVPPASR
jgi:uncharacterized damage-inducible protein DinB